MARRRRTKRERQKKRRQVLILGTLTIVAVVAVFWVIAPWLAPNLEKRSVRLPAVVYSRPGTLSPAISLTRAEIVTMLRNRGYVPSLHNEVIAGEYKREPHGLILRRRDFSRGDREVASETFTLAFGEDGTLTRIRDSLGNDLQRAEIEPEVLGRLYGSYWHDRIPVTLEEVPPHFLDTLIQVEDKRFYRHPGIDPIRILGALAANAKSGSAGQGGSTITQQLVKNVFLSNERTLRRKIKEAFLAILLERRYSKDEILLAYLNEVYLGQRGPVSIHGIGQAAYHYLGKDVEDLTLAESAFLVGMIQGPGTHSPHRSLEAAQERRDLVLGVMWEHEKITDEAYRQALDEPLRVRPPVEFENAAPFVVAHVRAQLADRYSAEELATNGLQIHTTIDARLQRLANDAVATWLTKLENARPNLRREESRLESAVVVMTPHTGEILALVGGRNYKDSQYNRATQARRQPGSAFKPIVALTAFHEGGYTLNYPLEDTELSIDTGQEIWKPENYDGKYRGVVTLREALEHSYNVPMVRLADELGPEKVVEVARRLGIDSPLQPVASLPLGTEEVTPLELTAAYAVLANGGLAVEPTTLHALESANGKPVFIDQRPTPRMFTEEETFLVTSALQGAVNRGTGKSLRVLGYEGTIAGKTGTTNSFRDAWFVGYTPDLAIGVWVGFDDGANLHLSGASAAIPIATDVLVGALGSTYDREFPVPERIEVVKIDPETGLRGGIGCPGEPEYFVRGTAPKRRCEAAGWKPIRNVLDAFRN